MAILGFAKAFDKVAQATTRGYPLRACADRWRPTCAQRTFAMLIVIHDENFTFFAGKTSLC